MTPVTSNAFGPRTSPDFHPLSTRITVLVTILIISFGIIKIIKSVYLKIRKREIKRQLTLHPGIFCFLLGWTSGSIQLYDMLVLVRRLGISDFVAISGSLSDVLIPVIFGSMSAIAWHIIYLIDQKITPNPKSA